LSEIVGAAAAGVNEEWRRDAMVCVTACQVNEKERVDDDSGAQLMKNHNLHSSTPNKAEKKRTLV